MQEGEREEDAKADRVEAQDPSQESYLGTQRQLLWSAAQSSIEKGECRFSAFEPCYIACIKDLEMQIAAKVQSIDFSTGKPDPASDVAPLLLQYSQLIDALERMESRDKVFEEDYLTNINSQDARARYHGVRRRVFNKDTDRVHNSLRQNLILVVLGYIYNWDLADKLKRSFGNLTNTMDRMLVGTAGGAALLTPMIIMTFATSQTARLIIVSVATMLFAAFMSLTSTSKDNVISSVAAYAAVMVVYIGSSGTG